MKNRLLFASTVSVLILSGCGQKEPAAATAASAPAPAAAAPAAPAPAAARVVEVTAGDNMKFSVAAIEAKVGEEVKIVLTNIGTLPKEAMGHNFVVLKPGTDVATFAAAASASKATDYIPDSLKDQVVAHTAILGPRKSDEIVLKGLAAGEYPFLCSFPGHFTVMKGVISVK